MLSHEKMIIQMLRDPKVRPAFDAQAEEFALLDETLSARRKCQDDKAQGKDAPCPESLNPVPVGPVSVGKGNAAGADRRAVRDGAGRLDAGHRNEGSSKSAGGCKSR